MWSRNTAASAVTASRVAPVHVRARAGGRPMRGRDLSRGPAPIRAQAPRRAAARRAVGHGTGEIPLVQDADLEYDPAEYPRLLQPILDGHADVVFGSRFAGSPRRVLFFWHTVANRLLTLVSNICSNLNLTDMETCYKVFRADILRRIPIRPNP